jgi:hypothetical protein
VDGPAGPASSGSGCVRTSSVFPERVAYQGNGTYTVKYKTGADFNACEAAAEQSMPFVINASVSISPPAAQPLLLRRPGSFTSISFDVPVSLNPGADSYEFRYAPNATLGPDGGITGEAQNGFVNLQSGTASVTFSAPGRYTFVARAKSFRSDVPTAWSPRVDVNVVAPFDLIAPRLTDARGPSYTVAGQVRETSATGKVTIAIGKGKNPKRFKTLGAAKIRKGGKFALRFRLTKLGSYRDALLLQGRRDGRQGLREVPGEVLPDLRPLGRQSTIRWTVTVAVQIEERCAGWPMLSVLQSPPPSTCRVTGSSLSRSRSEAVPARSASVTSCCMV